MRPEETHPRATASLLTERVSRLLTGSQSLDELDADTARLTHIYGSDAMVAALAEAYRATRRAG